MRCCSASKRSGEPLPGGEAVDLVDSEDRVTGGSTIEECLRIGLLHRAVAVLVYRSDGRYVLQKRSGKDLWHPGLLTLSSTGHVKRGEPYEEAARRELREELGIEAPVVRVKKYLLPPIRSGSLTEYEWVTLFTCASDSPCTFDPVELEGVLEVTGSQLRGMQDDERMTPDARIILADFLRTVREH